MLFHRELADNLNVCINCNHHMNITPRDRCISMFDGNVFEEFKAKEATPDPLKFKDQKNIQIELRMLVKKLVRTKLCFWQKVKWDEHRLL